MALFSPADRRIPGSRRRVAFANPFLPERIELEREALGDEFQPVSSHVWSRGPTSTTTSRTSSSRRARCRDC